MLTGQLRSIKLLTSLLSACILDEISPTAAGIFSFQIFSTIKSAVGFSFSRVSRVFYSLRYPEIRLSRPLRSVLRLSSLCVCAGGCWAAIYRPLKRSGWGHRDPQTPITSLLRPPPPPSQHSSLHRWFFCIRSADFSAAAALVFGRNNFFSFCIIIFSNKIDVLYHC